jgi:8-oxo-dGTP pyrophosphatase MutT (NUDIX family)
MDRILLAQPGWQEAIRRALVTVPRPIATDPRLLPRQAAISDGSGADAGRPRWDPADFPPPRRAATLLLLYRARGGELTIPLTVRQPDLRAHAGEVSLPGGAVDDGDDSPQAAALRETWEEIGVPPETVTLLGSLDEIWIPVSNFRLKPFIGALDRQPDLVPHTREVASIVEVPARLLLDDEAITEHLIEGPGWSLRAGAYRHDDQVIWGATARTLAMFASVLRQAAISA